MIEASGLSSINGITHGFFTREGGVSKGIYGSLNTGYGSDDDAGHVKENRRRIAAQLGVDSDRLLTIHQWHSADAVVAEKPWDVRQPPEGDAVVTDQPGIAVAINTADCTPVLFSSGDGRVVGAAHAGWKGAVGGILGSTVARMKELGATDIHAAIGPTISQLNYEVGPEYQARFIDRDAASERFFIPSEKPGAFHVRPAGVCSRATGRPGTGLNRGYRAVHLCRRAAVLFVPADGPSRRSGLRTPAFSYLHQGIGIIHGTAF